ncbi:MAG: IMP cyclohydrolase [Oscillospiraceae bacterium]|nr:IMP cyclohydrolase [Oscillospiraceae bacterium]MDD4412957.1 IMP cyclohydrolase [Oscillospiraceae bacterium]
MQLHNLAEELGATTYPGRGIIIGKSDDGKSMVIAYFIMGRSQNSRNRVFEETDDGICTKAFDESKMLDPSLIIYAPVRVTGNFTIVTNGNQTDTILEFIAQGKTFEDALRTRTFEPDSPNYTPRISGLVDAKNDHYRLSILKSDDGSPDGEQRFFFDYNSVPAGTGRFIHTYQGDGDPLLSFEGEPAKVNISGDIDSFTKTVWENLNDDNKVSLFTRFISCETGDYHSRIVNKNI